MISDEEIIKAFRVSDDEGYRKLLDGYGNYVYTIVSDRVRGLASEHDKEECTADIFIDTLKELKSCDFRVRSIKAIISVISKRRAIDLFRKLSGVKSNNESLDEITEEPVDYITPESVAAERSEKDSLWKAVVSLGKPDSDILILQFVYSKPAREIAKLLDMTAAAVNKRSSRAREKLKKILSEAEVV